MTEPGKTNQISIKKIAIVALLFVAIVLSWTGIGDQYAAELINNAIVDAGLLYGSARAVNALVSVIQSIDIGAVVFSISPGEILDPINDLVERFSSVMTVAIASLALQKILLFVLEHNIFNILLTLSGISVILSLIKTSRLMPFAVKVFFTLAILRISMTVIILANTAVDAAFLKQQEADDVKKLTALQSSLADVANSLDGGNQSAEISRLQTERTQLIETQKTINTDMRSARKTIEQLKDKKSERQSNKNIVDRLNPFEDDPKTMDLNKAISTHEDQLSALKVAESTVVKNINRVDEQIECAQTRAEGGSCSVGEWVSNKVGAIDVKGKIESIKDSTEGTIQSVLNLIMMAILKSVLLPLLFWWILYKSIKWIWNDKTVIAAFNKPRDSNPKLDAAS